MSDADLALDERIAVTERQLNRFRRGLAAALRTPASDDEIERHTLAVEACERRLDQLHMNQVALLRARRRPKVG
jgi:hypothetical protein